MRMKRRTKALGDGKPVPGDMVTRTPMKRLSCKYECRQVAVPRVVHQYRLDKGFIV